jgi:predicted DNA-binding transcriptional regulator AlpA
MIVEQPSLTQSNQYLTAAQLAARYQISLSSVWRRVKSGDLPPPIYVLERRPRWISRG